ncbi:MAG TPA: hypothetical protein VGD68_07495 [Streptosporangiaceae bacterium]
MTRRRTLAAIIPGIAAAAAALGFVVSTATASTSHPASAGRAGAPGSHQTTVAPAGVPEVFNCRHAQLRPGSLMLACADGNNYLARLSWSSWTASSATGTGIQEVNDCVPYCAAGKFRGYPADVVFWRSEPVPGHPAQRYFTRVTLRYPGPRPPVFSGGKQVSGPGTWTGPLASQIALAPPATQLNLAGPKRWPGRLLGWLA